MTQRQRGKWQLTFPLLIMLLFAAGLMPTPLLRLNGRAGGAMRMLSYPLTWPLCRLVATAVPTRHAMTRSVDPERESLQMQLAQAHNQIAALKQQLALTERELATISSIRKQFVGRRPPRLCRVAVISLNTGSSSGTVDINQGSMQQLSVGMAVVDGPDLIGRIAQVGPRTAVVELIVHKQARLGGTIGHDQALASTQPLGEPQNIWQFVADGKGHLTAKVSKRQTAAVGDLVRLCDQSSLPGCGWPAAVQGWVIGRVIAIEDLPDDLLRKQLIVEPAWRANGLGELTVIVPQNPAQPVGQGGAS